MAQRSTQSLVSKIFELILNLLKHISIMEVISGAPPSLAALSVKSQMKLHVESLKLISPSPHTEKWWKLLFRFFLENPGILILLVMNVNKSKRDRCVNDVYCQLPRWGRLPKRLFWRNWPHLFCSSNHEWLFWHSGVKIKQVWCRSISPFPCSSDPIGKIVLHFVLVGDAVFQKNALSKWLAAI